MRAMSRVSSTVIGPRSEWIDPDGFRGCGFFHVRGGLIVQQRGYWDSAQLNEIHPDVHPD